MAGSLGQKALGGAIAGVVAVVIGFIFIWTDMILSGYDFNTVLTTEYIPVIIAEHHLDGHRGAHPRPHLGAHQGAHGPLGRLLPPARGTR